MATTRQKARLSPQDWISEGFRALSDGGISVLKAEILALRLGTTKGSFYWHFRDLKDFKSAMLAAWLKIGTQDVMVTNDQAAATPRDKLRSLVAIVAKLNAQNSLGGLRAEPAVREWARNDVQAAEALTQVDTARVKYIAGLFRSCGLGRSAAQRNASMLYSVFVGQQAICVSQPHDMLPLLNQQLDLLLASISD